MVELLKILIFIYDVCYENMTHSNNFKIMIQISLTKERDVAICDLKAFGNVKSGSDKRLDEGCSRVQQLNAIYPEIVTRAEYESRNAHLTKTCVTYC